MQLTEKQEEHTMIWAPPLTWRSVLTIFVVTLLIAAMSQAAEATETKLERCIASAEKVLGHRVRAREYRIVLGTDRPHEVLRAKPDQRDLICGFGGGEEVPGTIRSGDIFISGSGGSLVRRQIGGIVVGGHQGNVVQRLRGGRFIGGRGRDVVEGLYGGVFYGGRGFDYIIDINGGRFVGGRGPDAVAYLYDGLFLGQGGDDAVQDNMTGGKFDGGAGNDAVAGYEAGSLVSVESCQPALACP